MFATGVSNLHCAQCFSSEIKGSNIKVATNMSIMTSCQAQENLKGQKEGNKNKGSKDMTD